MAFGNLQDRMEILDLFLVLQSPGHQIIERVGSSIDLAALQCGIQLRS